MERVFVFHYDGAYPEDDNDIADIVDDYSRRLADAAEGRAVELAEAVKLAIEAVDGIRAVSVRYETLVDRSAQDVSAVLVMAEWNLTGTYSGTAVSTVGEIRDALADGRLAETRDPEELSVGRGVEHYRR